MDSITGQIVIPTTGTFTRTPINYFALSMEDVPSTNCFAVVDWLDQLHHSVIHS